MKINTNIRNMTNESHIIECERFFRELFVHVLLIFCCVFTLTRHNPFEFNMFFAYSFVSVSVSQF